jgi:hypothetical protein
MLRLPPETGDTHFVELVRHPDVCKLVATALTGDSPAPVEVQLDMGARRTFVAHSVPVAASRGGGAVLVLRDITDLRRADWCRGFVANVSRLRTPLTAIRGYVGRIRPAHPNRQASSSGSSIATTSDGAARRRSAAAGPARRRAGDL